MTQPPGVTTTMFGTATKHTLLVTLLSLAGSARADVLHVGPVLGSTPHPGLRDAIQLALDGDTILVRTGVYQGFDLMDRGIDIVAAEGAVVRVAWPSSIRDLGAGKEVVVSGLRFEGDGDYSAALEIDSCAGSVRLVDCILRGDDFAVSPGCIVAGCSDVAFFNPDIEGGRGGANLFCGNPASPGLELVGSVVDVYGGTLRGGRSFTQGGMQDFGGDGGDGCRVSGGGELRAFSSSFVGRHGGSGDTGTTGCPCGLGGVGLRVTDPGSFAELLSGSTVGGWGGFYYGGTDCPSSPPRIGAITDIQGPARWIRVDRVARGGSLLQGELRGEAGEAVVLVLSLRSTHTPMPAYHGVLLAGTPYFARGIPAGTVPGSGLLPWAATVAGFGNTLIAEHMVIQPLFLGATGRWLGDGDMVSLLAPGL